MKTNHTARKHKSFPTYLKTIALVLCFILAFEQSGFAQVAGQVDISGHLNELFSPFINYSSYAPRLRYISYDRSNQSFKIIIDKLTSDKKSVPLELLKAFFTGVSLPNSDFWVNLRPDSPDEIIDDSLAKTDLGKIMLEADLELKRDLARATFPSTPEGREYWDKIYKKIEEVYGYGQINSGVSINTRIWIIPGEVIICEDGNSAYIYKASLNVLTEAAYLSNKRGHDVEDEQAKAINDYSAELMQGLILPKISKEVNTAGKYAPLRQAYCSLILAQWFKRKFYGAGGLYPYLIDREDLTGLTSAAKWSKDKYFEKYRKSYREKEYDLRLQVFNLSGQSIRTYSSGGVDFSGILGGGANPAQVRVIETGDLQPPVTSQAQYLTITSTSAHSPIEVAPPARQVEIMTPSPAPSGLSVRLQERLERAREDHLRAKKAVDEINARLAAIDSRLAKRKGHIQKISQAQERYLSDGRPAYAVTAGRIMIQMRDSLARLQAERDAQQALLVAASQDLSAAQARLEKIDALAVPTPVAATLALASVPAAPAAPAAAATIQPPKEQSIQQFSKRGMLRAAKAIREEMYPVPLPALSFFHSVRLAEELKNKGAPATVFFTHDRLHCFVSSKGYIIDPFAEAFVRRAKRYGVDISDYIEKGVLVVPAAHGSAIVYSDQSEPVRAEAIEWAQEEIKREKSFLNQPIPPFDPELRSKFNGLAEYLQGAFAPINQGKQLRQVYVSGRFEEIEPSLHSALTDVPDEETVLLYLVVNYRDGQDVRILVDKASRLKGQVRQIRNGDLDAEREEYDLLFDFTVFNGQRTIQLSNISVGNPEDQGRLRSLRARGIASGSFEKFAEILSSHYAGWKVSSLCIEELNDKPFKVVPHFMKKYFSAQPALDASGVGFIGEINRVLTILPGYIRGLYVGRVPSGVSADSLSAEAEAILTDPRARMRHSYEEWLGDNPKARTREKIERVFSIYEGELMLSIGRALELGQLDASFISGLVDFVVQLAVETEGARRPTDAEKAQLRREAEKKLGDLINDTAALRDKIAAAIQDFSIKDLLGDTILKDKEREKEKLASLLGEEGPRFNRAILEFAMIKLKRAWAEYWGQEEEAGAFRQAQQSRQDELGKIESRVYERIVQAIPGFGESEAGERTKNPSRPRGILSAATLGIVLVSLAAALAGGCATPSQNFGPAMDLPELAAADLPQDGPGMLMPVDQNVPPEILRGRNLGPYYEIINIGRSDDAGKVDYLLGVLKQWDDSNWDGPSLEALLKMTQPVGVSGSRPAFNFELSAGKLLGFLESGAIHILALYNETDPSRRAAAAWALGELKPAVDQGWFSGIKKRKIIADLSSAMLNDRDPYVRAASAWALSRYIDSTNPVIEAADYDVRVKSLIQATNDKGWIARYYAVLALASSRDPRVTQPLINVIEKEDNPYVLALAVRAALSLQAYGTVPAVLKALERLKLNALQDEVLYAADSFIWDRISQGLSGFASRSPQTRRHLIFSFIKSIQYLQSRRDLDNKYDIVNYNYLPLFERLAKALNITRAEIDNDLRGLDPRIASALLNILRPELPPGAIPAPLTTLQDAEELYKASISNYQNKSPEIAEEIGALEQGKNLSALSRIMLFDSAQGMRRILAADAIARIGDTSSMQVLIRGLNDSHPVVRQASAKALRQLFNRSCFVYTGKDGNIARALGKACQDKDWVALGFLVDALRTMGNSDAQEALSAVFEEQRHPVVQKMVLEALASLTGESLTLTEAAKNLLGRAADRDSEAATIAGAMELAGRILRTNDDQTLVDAVIYALLGYPANHESYQGYSDILGKAIEALRYSKQWRQRLAVFEQETKYRGNYQALNTFRSLKQELTGNSAAALSGLIAKASEADVSVVSAKDRIGAINKMARDFSGTGNIRATMCLMAIIDSGPDSDIAIPGISALMSINNGKVAISGPAGKNPLMDIYGQVALNRDAKFSNDMRLKAINALGRSNLPEAVNPLKNLLSGLMAGGKGGRYISLLSAAVDSACNIASLSDDPDLIEGVVCAMPEFEGDPEKYEGYDTLRAKVIEALSQSRRAKTRINELIGESEAIGDMLAVNRLSGLLQEISDPPEQARREIPSLYQRSPADTTDKTVKDLSIALKPSAQAGARIAALESLGRSLEGKGNINVTRQLIRLIRSEQDPDICGKAILSLSQINANGDSLSYLPGKHPIVDVLVEIISDSGRALELRGHAILALSKIKRNEAVIGMVNSYYLLADFYPYRERGQSAKEKERLVLSQAIISGLGDVKQAAAGEVKGRLIPRINSGIFTCEDSELLAFLHSIDPTGAEEVNKRTGLTPAQTLRDPAKVIAGYPPKAFKAEVDRNTLTEQLSGHNQPLEQARQNGQNKASITSSIEAMRLLYDPDPEIRIAAAFYLGENQTPASQGALQTAFESEIRSNELVAAAILRALGQFESPAGLQDSRFTTFNKAAGLLKEKPRARRELAHCLATSGDQRAVKIIQDLLKTDDVMTRVLAAEAAFEVTKRLMTPDLTVSLLECAENDYRFPGDRWYLFFGERFKVSGQAAFDALSRMAQDARFHSILDTAIRQVSAESMEKNITWHSMHPVETELLKMYNNGLLKELQGSHSKAQRRQWKGIAFWTTPIVFLLILSYFIFRLMMRPALINGTPRHRGIYSSRTRGSDDSHGPDKPGSSGDSQRRPGSAQTSNDPGRGAGGSSSRVAGAAVNVTNGGTDELTAWDRELEGIYLKRRELPAAELNQQVEGIAGKILDVLTRNSWESRIFQGARGLLRHMHPDHFDKVLEVSKAAPFKDNLDLQRQIADITLERASRLSVSIARVQANIHDWEKILERGRDPGLSRDNLAEILKICKGIKEVFPLRLTQETNDSIGSINRVITHVHGLIGKTVNILLKQNDTRNRKAHDTAVKFLLEFGHYLSDYLGASMYISDLDIAKGYVIDENPMPNGKNGNGNGNGNGRANHKVRYSFWHRLTAVPHMEMNAISNLELLMPRLNTAGNELTPAEYYANLRPTRIGASRSWLTRKPVSIFVSMLLGAISVIFLFQKGQVSLSEPTFWSMFWPIVGLGFFASLGFFLIPAMHFIFANLGWRYTRSEWLRLHQRIDELGKKWDNYPAPEAAAPSRAEPAGVSLPATGDYALLGPLVTAEDVRGIAVMADLSGSQPVDIPEGLILRLQTLFGPGRSSRPSITVIPQAHMHTSDNRPIRGPVRTGGRIFVGDDDWARYSGEPQALFEDMAHEQMAEWVAEKRSDLDTDAHDLARDMAQVAGLQGSDDKAGKSRGRQEAPGGIDFREINFTVRQAPGAFRGPDEFFAGNIGAEMDEIQRLISARIIPSSERINDLLKNLPQAKEEGRFRRINNFLAEIFVLEEEYSMPCDNSFVNMLQRIVSIR